ncbi:unnamed protein product [Ilex paraguariensis]|uniref:Uncharacterized protein n=1 Tax=Ilex paraguariensis TaxID=185542 RepID=A0ABC8TJE7_9AQUA
MPDFCSVYVISKGKISSTLSASRPPPFVSPIRNQLLYQSSSSPDMSETQLPSTMSIKGVPRSTSETPTNSLPNDTSFIKSPFTHRRGPNGKPYELSQPDADISFVSSGRPSTDRMFPSFDESFEMGPTSQLSSFSDIDNKSFESLHLGRRSVDMRTSPESSYVSLDSDRSITSQAMVRVSKPLMDGYMHATTHN